MMRATNCWEDRDFFSSVILPDTLNSRYPFHLQQPYFVILCTDYFPHSVTHTLASFSMIYTFKNEICLIQCEENMSHCALVAPQLKSHFIMRKTGTLLSFLLFPSSASLCPSIVDLSLCCVSTFEVKTFTKRSHWIVTSRSTANQVQDSILHVKPQGGNSAENFQTRKIF